MLYNQIGMHLKRWNFTFARFSLVGAVPDWHKHVKKINSNENLRCSETFLEFAWSRASCVPFLYPSLISPSNIKLNFVRTSMNWIEWASLRFCSSSLVIGEVTFFQHQWMPLLPRWTEWIPSEVAKVYVSLWIEGDWWHNVAWRAYGPGSQTFPHHDWCWWSVSTTFFWVYKR